MTNNLVLPLLALVLAILAALLPFRPEDQPPDWRQKLRGIRGGAALSAIVVLLFAVAHAVWPNTFKDGNAISIALAIGAAMGILSAATEPGQGGFALGMAVLGASAIHLLPAAGNDTAQVAYVAGVFVAAFAISGISAKSLGGYLCALMSLMVVAVDFLGQKAVSGSEASAWAGVVLGISFLVSALVTGVISKASKNAVLRSGTGLVLLLLVGYLSCRMYLGRPELGNLWIGGVTIGAIVHLILTGQDRPDSFRFVLCTVIWLGAATVAFGMNQGYGMAVTLLGGAATLVLFGNVRGLMTISVPASVLLYRLFRELYPDDARAPDIGQHYTMIGIAIGALWPLLPLEWARGREIAGWRAFAASAVWILILLGLPVAAAVLLGSKGAIGLVVGLSFAAVIEGMRGSVSLAPVGLATGLGALTVLNYGWLGDWTDLERAVKVKAVIAVAVASLILSAALFGLSREKAPAPAEQ